MAVQRFHLALLAIAAVAAGVLLTDPALAQAFPSDQGNLRDDPDAYAQGWRRTSYEPARAQPAVERKTERANEPKRDFVSELLGPAADSMRRLPAERTRPAARTMRTGSGGGAASPTLAANRTPQGQDPSLIFE